MLLCIPVSQFDKHLLPALQRALEAFSPGIGHDLLVVTYPKASKEALSFKESVKHLFRSSSVHQLSADYALAWPREMNMLFQGTAMEAQKMLKDGECWMWFEPDTTPIKPTWLSVLHSAYYADVLPAEKERREPKRFLGVREPAIRSMNGERMNVAMAGHIMAAVGVYPANFATLSAPLLKVLPQNGQPFYNVLQWYMINSLAETDLIQNNRETVEYKDGQSKSIARNAWDVHWNNPIGANAMVVHGCKDGSLLEMILGPVAEKAPKPVIVEQLQEIPSENSSQETSEFIPAETPAPQAVPRKRHARMTKEGRAKLSAMMTARHEAKRAAKALAEQTPAEPVLV